MIFLYPLIKIKIHFCILLKNNNKNNNEWPISKIIIIKIKIKIKMNDLYRNNNSDE